MTHESRWREEHLKFFDVISTLRDTANRRGDLTLADGLARCLEIVALGTGPCPIASLLRQGQADEMPPAPSCIRSEPPGVAASGNRAVDVSVIDLVLAALSSEASERGDLHYVRALRDCRNRRHGDDYCPLRRVSMRPPPGP